MLWQLRRWACAYTISLGGCFLFVGIVWFPNHVYQVGPKSSSSGSLHLQSFEALQPAADGLGHGLPYSTSLIGSAFEKTRTLVLFIGYPRSGSTLIGSLLDAHPHAIIANEYSLLGKWQNFTEREKTREFIFSELLRNSQEEAASQQRAPQKNYFFHYNVPKQWQGKYDGYVQVIGDKKGSTTTRRLSSENNTLLRELHEVLQVPIKFIHLIRNPFDNIATMVLRAAEPSARNKASRGQFKLDDREMLRRQAATYLKLARQNANLRNLLSPSVMDVHYSDFVKDPARGLVRLCRFLELDCSEAYVSSCISIIFKQETYTRRNVVWHSEIILAVQNLINEVEFLNGYVFDIV